MTHEPFVILALFALTAVAFIGVLNARGAWRAGIAAAVALLCLGLALWGATAYRAARLAGLPRDVPAPSSATAVGPAGTSDPVDDLSELIGILAATRALRDSMAAEDPSRARALPDSEYQAFEERSLSHLAQARILRERAARLSASPGLAPGLEDAAESLNRALQVLNGSARDLQAFFRATGREEEQRLTSAFRAGVDSADTPLRRAESRAGASEFLHDGF